MAAPQITDVYPAPGAKGVVIGDQVTVLFDQAMDEESINTGTMVLIGPDDAFVFGPDFTPLDRVGIEDEQILNSPYIGAYVEGVITFERINPSSGDAADIDDFTGAGNLYKTKAIFTPSKPLAAGVEYRLLLAGDENTDDDFVTGVRTRTVFDTVVTATGSGLLSFGGPFTGAVNAEYGIEITVGGPTGQAEYVWWNAVDPLTTFPGITSTGRRQLENGVWVACEPDGSFTIGDTFTVVCKPSEVLESNYSWVFNTGSGSILVPPSVSSASGISAITSTSGAGLQVVSIVPANRTTNLDPNDVSEIVITFNGPIDEATITDEAITIWTEPVNGDTNNAAIEYEGEIAKILSVSGNTLTVQIT